MSTVSLKKRNRIHPKKFAMYAGIGSIIMMFAGFTSAYIVRRAQGNWVEFALPFLFWISTLVILASSYTLVMAQRSAKKDDKVGYKKFLGYTLGLGWGFVVLQYLGWLQMQNIGMLLEGNPSGAFIYVISGMHALHVLGGIAFLTYFYIKTQLKTDPIKDLMASINPERYLGLELLATYWHFVGILWLYLLIFFSLYR